MSEEKDVIVTSLEKRQKVRLIQWVDDNGRVRRGTVPLEVVKRKEGVLSVPAKALAMAVPHGVAWAEHIDPITITPEQIEIALQNHGVWTINDLRYQPSVVNTVLVNLIGFSAKIPQIIRGADDGTLYEGKGE